MKLKGFTLIELIVVIGIIAVLAAIVILAVNPARQFAQARNAKRNNDVKAILDAFGQYAASSNSGLYPTDLANDCNFNGPQSVDSTFNNELVPTYLTSIPVDPRSGNPYQACKTTGGDGSERVTVSAPEAELNATISVSR